MIKAIVLLSRKEGMSPEEFRRYVEERHGPLVQQLPGLRRLVINYVHANPAGPAPAYDAVAEDWFDSLEAMQAAFGSSVGQAVQQDSHNFLDLSRMQILVAEEREVPIATPAGG